MHCNGRLMGLGIDNTERRRHHHPPSSDEEQATPDPPRFSARMGRSLPKGCTIDFCWCRVIDHLGILVLGNFHDLVLKGMGYWESVTASVQAGKQEGKKRVRSRMESDRKVRRIRE